MQVRTKRLIETERERETERNRKGERRKGSSDLRNDKLNPGTRRKEQSTNVHTQLAIFAPS